MPYSLLMTNENTYETGDEVTVETRRGREQVSMRVSHVLDHRIFVTGRWDLDGQGFDVRTGRCLFGNCARLVAGRASR